MRAVAPAILILLAIVVPVEAGGCTTSAATPVKVQTTTFYVATECVQGTCVAGTTAHIYQETNGRDGLQRNDANKDDTAGGNCYVADTHLV